MRTRNRALRLGASLFLLLPFMLTGCGGGDVGNPPPPPAAGVVQLAAVAPLFPANGALWNDYVAGNSTLTATDVPCNAVTDIACLHAGERRVVVATGMTSCTGLTAADDLGAFIWECDASTGQVRFISTGLANGKSLTDLIDFATPGFKSNKVTVYANGAVWGVTAGTAWWNNQVVVQNVGGALSTASTIYLVTFNPGAAYSLAADKIALVIEPGVALTGAGLVSVITNVAPRAYLWLEGSVNASGAVDGVNLGSVRFSVLRNLTADNALTYGIYVNSGSSFNTFHAVAAANNASIGVFLNGATNNTLSGLTVAKNSAGIYLSGTTNNTLSGVTAANNGYGIYLDGAANNTLSGVTATNNVTGVILFGAMNNTLSGVTVANNGPGVSSAGVYLFNASNNTISGVTVANNTTGVWLTGTSTSDTLDGVTAANNDTGIQLDTGTSSTFTGPLKVGNNATTDCNVAVGAAGLNGSCSNSGSSNAILTTGITLAAAFVGKVTTDDLANASDTLGAATFPIDPAVFDWTHFDNSYRGWGLDGDPVFPNLNQRGAWTAGAGRIWDWSLRATDTINKDAFLLPAGNDTITQIWSGTPNPLNTGGCNAMVAGSTWNGANCETVFLKNAVELPLDGVGNHNGLCEAGEVCLFAPNIGAYPGHGSLVGAGTFTPGILTGIRLFKYQTNGR